MLPCSMGLYGWLRENRPEEGLEAFSWWSGSYFLSAALCVVVYGLATPGYRPGKKRARWGKALYAFPLGCLLASLAVLYLLGR